MKKFSVVVNMKGVISCTDAQLVLANTEDEAKEKAVSLLRSIYGDVFWTYNVESCKLLVDDPPKMADHHTENSVQLYKSMGITASNIDEARAKFNALTDEQKYQLVLGLKKYNQL